MKIFYLWLSCKYLALVAYYLFSVILIFFYLPIKSSENISVDLKEFNNKESVAISGPDHVKSEFGNLLPMADDGRLLLCFFAPGCDHCRATIKSIDSLSRINSDFPKVEIVFMEEEVEKIPDFFDYAGNEFSYIVLDISIFVFGFSETFLNNFSTISSLASIGRSPIFIEFNLKISANLDEMIASNPQSWSPQGACSLEDPVPKFVPVSKTFDSLKISLFNGKLASFFQS